MITQFVQKNGGQSLPYKIPRMPQLLVSVRNVEEAAAAIRGGCDILDIKEPNRGSLGMATADVIREIAQFANQQTRSLVITAALGEIHDYWATQQPNLPNELSLVKLGCAHLASCLDWPQRWQQIHRTISADLSPTTGWVAVAYADWQLAEAPHPDQIVTEALLAGSRGVLLDTYAKSGRRLLDWITTNELQHIARRLHAAGLFLALAGSLRQSDLPHLRSVPADIIAIRGAACAGGQRTDAIQESAVRKFRNAMQSMRYHPTPPVGVVYGPLQ
jgi:uncharacterized protein (UPF0264 family)